MQSNINRRMLNKMQDDHEALQDQVNALSDMYRSIVKLTSTLCEVTDRMDEQIDQLNARIYIHDGVSDLITDTIDPDIKLKFKNCKE